MIDPRYTKVAADSRSMDEFNDCSVRACALVAGISYAEAHNLLAKFGRKYRHAFNVSKYIAALESIGVELGRVEWEPRKETDGTRFTGVTVGGAKRFKKGRFLVRFKRHVAAMVDGELLDWTKGKRKRVEQILEIKLPENPIDLPK